MMFGEGFKRKYALSDKGVSNTKKGVFWTVIVNLVVMGGMGILYLLMNDYMETLTEGKALPDSMKYIVMIAAFLVLSMVMYYVITYFLGLYSKKCYRAGLHYFSRMLLFSALFVILELVLKDSLQTGIAVSVIYVFAMLFMVVRRMFYVDSCEEVKQCTLNEREKL